MKILPNRIYGVRTAAGLRGEMTALENPTLPADGEIIELNPVFRGAGGFMLGFGESVHGHRYRFDPEFKSGRGSFRRCLVSYRNCSFANGVWTLKPGSVIDFNHYVAGRRLKGGSLIAICAAARGGAAVLERVDGGKVVELCRFGGAGCPGRAEIRLADEWSPCPSFRVRGLDGCDVDFAGYVYEAELSGPEEEITGATDLRPAPPVKGL